MHRVGRAVVLTLAAGIGVAAAAACAVALVLLLLVVLIAAMMRGSFDAAFEGSEREHLPPIPIDPEACPYVAAMHAAANGFQIAYPTLGGTAYDADQQPLSWPETQMRLGHAGAVLEWSIAGSLEHFPPEVVWHLTTARDALREGRSELEVARTSLEFSTRTGELLREGQLAFGYAGDLIGAQCAVPLRADPETMLYPFATSTVPRVRPQLGTP